MKMDHPARPAVVSAVRAVREGRHREAQELFSIARARCARTSPPSNALSGDLLRAGQSHLEHVFGANGVSADGDVDGVLASLRGMLGEKLAVH